MGSNGLHLNMVRMASVHIDTANGCFSVDIQEEPIKMSPDPLTIFIWMQMTRG